MNKTTKTENASFLGKALVTTPELQGMLSCGRVTALQIGQNAGARVSIGRRVLWNTRKINSYLDAISGV